MKEVEVAASRPEIEFEDGVVRVFGERGDVVLEKPSTGDACREAFALLDKLRDQRWRRLQAAVLEHVFLYGGGSSAEPVGLLSRRSK